MTMNENRLKRQLAFLKLSLHLTGFPKLILKRHAGSDPSVFISQNSQAESTTENE